MLTKKLTIKGIQASAKELKRSPSKLADLMANKLKV